MWRAVSFHLTYITIEHDVTLSQRFRYLGFQEPIRNILHLSSALYSTCLCFRDTFLIFSPKHCSVEPNPAWLSEMG